MARLKAVKEPHEHLQRERINLALTKEALDLLEKMRTRLGISQTSVLELAIREKADREGYRGAA